VPPFDVRSILTKVVGANDKLSTLTKSSSPENNTSESLSHSVVAGRSIDADVNVIALGLRNLKMYVF
jgi:hypothetical protein